MGSGEANVNQGLCQKVPIAGLGPKICEADLESPFAFAEAHGAHKLFYHKERLATWQIRQAILFENSALWPEARIV